MATDSCAVVGGRACGLCEYTGMMNVYAYTRVSGLSQAEGDGPARQLVAIQRWAAARGGQVIRQYNEVLSGKSEHGSRPQFVQMREDMLAGNVKIVVIERLDRLARDLMIQEAAIKDFQRNGLSIVSTVEEDLCSTDPTRKLIRQILGAFADYERQMIVDKLASARARKVANGELILGRAPYGWKKVRRNGKHVMEEDRFERAIVERIRGMRAEKYTWRAIADELNSTGIPTRDMGKWFPATVLKIYSRAREER